MPNINWKEFMKFLEKDEIMKGFIESWKRNHALVVEVELKKDQLSEGDYQNQLRMAIKGRLPYDNEIRTRMNQLFNQFLYENFVQEAGEKVLETLGKEKIGGEERNVKSEGS